MIDNILDYVNDEGSSTSEKYRNGDFMQWTILVDIKIFKMTYKLKLNKIKQNDSEILYQIIDDMSNQMQEMKNEIQELKATIANSKCIIASWSSRNTLENKYVYV